MGEKLGFASANKEMKAEVTEKEETK